MDYKFSAVQQQAQSMKDELNNRSLTHLDTFLLGVGEIEPPRYHWVNGQIQPPLLLVEFTHEATRFDIGNVIYPNEDIKRVTLEVMNGQCASRKLEKIEDEDDPRHIALPFFAAKHLRGLWEQKYQALADHRDHINAIRSLAYNDLKQKPRLAVNGKAPGSQQPSSTDLVDRPNYSSTCRKRAYGEPIPAHPTNKRQRIGLSSAPSSQKIQSFNNFPNTLKIQLYDALTKDKAVQYDNLEMAAWNVCAIHQYVGTEFPELGKAIWEMGRVLVGSHEVFKNERVVKMEMTGEKIQREDDGEETVGPKSNSEKREGLSPKNQRSVQREESNHPLISHSTNQDAGQGQGSSKEITASSRPSNMSQEPRTLEQLQDGVAEQLRKLRKEAESQQAHLKNYTGNGAAPGQNLPKECGDDVIGLDATYKQKDGHVRNEKQDVMVANISAQPATAMSKLAGSKEGLHSLSSVPTSQNGRRVADYFGSDSNPTSTAQGTTSNSNRDGRTFQSASGSVYTRVSGYGDPHEKEGAQVPKKRISDGCYFDPSGSLKPSETVGPEKRNNRRSPSVAIPAPLGSTSRPVPTDIVKATMNLKKVVSTNFERETLRPASASPMDLKRQLQQLTKTSLTATNMQRSNSDTPPKKSTTANTTSTTPKPTDHPPKPAVVDLTDPSPTLPKTTPNPPKPTHEQTSKSNRTPSIPLPPTVQESRLPPNSSQVHIARMPSNHLRSPINMPSPFNNTESHYKPAMSTFLGNSSLGTRKNPTNGVAPVAPAMFKPLKSLGNESRTDQTGAQKDRQIGYGNAQ